MRTIIGVVSLLLLSGCAYQPSGFFEEKVRVVSTEAPAPIQKTATPKAHYDEGYIKGILRKVVHEGTSGLWHYEVEGTDTSNFKLPYARFSHTAFLAPVGAAVYVQIEKGKLLQLYALEGASVVSKTQINLPKTPQKHPKRTLNRQVFSVPESETIALD